MINFAEQTAAGVSAFMLLVDYLTGVCAGVFGSMVFGSVLENHRMSLLEQAPGPISAGVRVLLCPFIRDDGGYLRSLPPGRRTVAHRRRDGSSGSTGREVN